MMRNYEMMDRQSPVAVVLWPVVDASLSKGCKSDVTSRAILLSRRRSKRCLVVVENSFWSRRSHATANTARIEAIISAMSQGEL